MEGLPSHVLRIHYFHQISTAYSSHEIVHCKFQAPCANLTPGVNARKPQTSTIFMAVGEEMSSFLRVEIYKFLMICIEKLVLQYFKRMNIKLDIFMQYLLHS